MLSPLPETFFAHHAGRGTVIDHFSTRTHENKHAATLHFFRRIWPPKKISLSLALPMASTMISWCKTNSCCMLLPPTGCLLWQTNVSPVSLSLQSYWPWLSKFQIIITFSSCFIPNPDTHSCNLQLYNKLYITAPSYLITWTAMQYTHIPLLC